MSDLQIMEELRDKDVATIGELPEELRGKTPEELQGFIELLDAHLRSIHQDEDTGELRDKTPAERKAFDYGLKLRDMAMARLEEHRNIAEVFKRRPKAAQRVMAGIRADVDDAFGDVRRMTTSEARDAALRRLDDRSSAGHLKSYEKDEVEKQLRRNTDIARRILVTETPEYRSAFQKLVTHPNGQLLLDEDERVAVRRFEEYRAASESNTTGGYGIPVFIDPSIILTAQGTDNPFLTLARQVDINSNAWKGVSSAGVSWSFDAEATEVSDDAASDLAQPIVNLRMARGFLPYSIEIGQDYPGFADEMQTLLSEGYNELLINKLTNGTSGSNEPDGLITVLSASSGNRVAVGTSGSVSAPDPYKVWASLPQRFRSNAAWMMSVGANNAIRQLGAANVYHAVTVTLPEAAADKLFNKAVYENAYMKDVTTSTSAKTEVAVVGDFRNYLIARRGGMTVELVPHLFSTGNGLPRGQRGWFAYARIGGGVVNTNGFRLLVNS